MSDKDKYFLDWNKVDRVIINLAGEWIGMGNVIMTSPLGNAIHFVNPKCKVYIILTGERWVPIIKVMHGFPKPIVVGKDFYRFRWLYLNAFLRFRRPWLKTVYFYDYLAPRMRASLLGKLIGAQYRFGYGKKEEEKENTPLYNTKDISFSSQGTLSFDYSKGFQSIVGLKINSGPRLVKDRFPGRGRKILANLEVKNEQMVIALHPGSSPKNKIKRWPLSSFSKLAELLNTESGVTVLVILGPGEESLRNEWQNPNYVKFIQGYSLADIASILSCIDGIVSNDSGIMHLAFALGVPGLGLFGPTTSENYIDWYPQAKFLFHDMQCRTCYGTNRYGECDKYPAPCMSGISVEEVLKRLEELFSVLSK